MPFSCALLHLLMLLHSFSVIWMRILRFYCITFFNKLQNIRVIKLTVTDDDKEHELMLQTFARFCCCCCYRSIFGAYRWAKSNEHLNVKDWACKQWRASLSNFIHINLEISIKALLWKMKWAFMHPQNMLSPLLKQWNHVQVFSFASRRERRRENEKDAWWW